MKAKLARGFPIFLASLNMRASFVLIGPLIPIIRKAFQLSTIQISILPAVPLICYAGSSVIMGRVGKIGSSNKIITFALTVFSLASVARAFTGLWGLFLFSFVMGISVAVMNYEIPVWVKRHTPADAGFMTGVYVTVMGLAGSLSIAISVPLAQHSSLSWRAAMIPWMFVALLSTLYWRIKMANEPAEEGSMAIAFWRTPTFRKPMAWALVFFFGFESMCFYATSTWFPTLLTTKGFTLGSAALAVSISALIGSAISVAAPHYIGKVKDQRPILVSISVIIALSFLMMIFQSGAILYLWLCISNIGISVCFPLSLLLCGTKSLTAEGTRTMSTMMQSIGYICSAMGPIVMSFLFEVSKDWNVALLGVVGFSCIQVLMAWIVGKPSLIEERVDKVVP